MFSRGLIVNNLRELMSSVLFDWWPRETVFSCVGLLRFDVKSEHDFGAEALFELNSFADLLSLFAEFRPFPFPDEACVIVLLRGTKKLFLCHSLSKELERHFLRTTLLQRSAYKSKAIYIPLSPCLWATWHDASVLGHRYKALSWIAYLSLPSSDYDTAVYKVLYSWHYQSLYNVSVLNVYYDGLFYIEWVIICRRVDRAGKRVRRRKWCVL